jgi:excisionase family DNA binding protein
MEGLPKKRFFRPDEAAAILVLSRRTVYRMIRDGRITAVKWGRGPWRIPRESLTSLFPGEKL